MAGADDPLRNQRSGAKNKPLVLPTTSANPPPQLPPSISLKSRILTSRILLPQSPIITYRTFDFSQPHPDPDFILECARRQIVQAWDCTEDDIAQSFLVKVALQQTPKLWIFRINSLKGNVKLFQTINELQFSGLHGTRPGSKCDHHDSQDSHCRNQPSIVLVCGTVSLFSCLLSAARPLRQMLHGQHRQWRRTHGSFTSAETSTHSLCVFP
jgi:hypothetical protein